MCEANTRAAPRIRQLISFWLFAYQLATDSIFTVSLSISTLVQ